MPRFPRVLLPLFAFVVLATSCGSNSDGVASERSVGSIASSTTEPVATSEAPSTTADSTDPGETAPDLTDDELVDATIDSIGFRINDDERACIKTSEYVDADAIRIQDPKAGDLLLLATFRCAAGSIAELTAAGLVIDGLESDGITCAMTEAIRAIGELDREDALVAIDETAYPELARADALRRGQEVCGLTEDQVAAVLDT